MDQVEKLKELHYAIRGFLDKKDYKSVMQIMSEAINRVDVNELKTIEIITRPFENHPELGEGYKAIKMVFDSAMKLINR